MKETQVLSKRNEIPILFDITENGKVKLYGINKKKVKDTLLISFMNKKIASYREPVRVGIPKGQSVGINETKYRASLYMLCKPGFKYLANCLNVKHGTLLKWRTEKAFKQVFDSHCVAFVETISLYVDKLCKKYEGTFITSRTNKYDTPLNYASEAKTEIDESFIDVNTYDIKLLEHVFKYLCRDIIKSAGDAAPGHSRNYYGRLVILRWLKDRISPQNEENKKALGIYTDALIGIEAQIDLASWQKIAYDLTEVVTANKSTKKDVEFAKGIKQWLAP